MSDSYPSCCLYHSSGGVKTEPCSKLPCPANVKNKMLDIVATLDNLYGELLEVMEDVPMEDRVWPSIIEGILSSQEKDETLATIKIHMDKS